MERFVVTKDTERTAPIWLTRRLNNNLHNIRLIWCIRDGYNQLKGVKINSELAGIGDTIVYDGRRLSVERK